MKQKTTKKIPLIATGMAPAATVTSALLSPLALGATGDLDPGFGDVGRLGPILNGPAWSLQLLEDDTMLLAGGGVDGYYYYYWGYYYFPTVTNFVAILKDPGSIDLGLSAALVGDAQVFDVARQPDGQTVVVGRSVGASATETRLIVFRLQSNGQPDPTFGDSGIFQLSVADHGEQNLGTSVVLDPDGRIVVAGSRDDNVIVLRLLLDGSFDDSFATSGMFVGPETHDFSDDDSGARTTVLRTADGGYRITASNGSGCQIVALTANGAIDNTFGVSGIATVEAPAGASTYCNAMVAQPDERLLVAGNASGAGFAARMLADGQPDTGFSADAVSLTMADATAVAVDVNGHVIVGGTGVSGASIMRLQASGELDALFGNAGATLIDIQSDTGTTSIVHDMIALADGSVVAAGGDHEANHAFVVKLLGDAGGDSPGVLGVTEQDDILTAEGTAEIIVNVRRTGGASGSVSLVYDTSPSDSWTANAGLDYATVAGNLAWADGNTAEQQIHVPILADDSAEVPEAFLVRLRDIQGGAGLGTNSATIRIAADGGPFGQLGFSEYSYASPEFGTAKAEVYVTRNYYNSGAVSVTVTPIAGSAMAGVDFMADPVTVSWADGDWDWKLVEIPVIDDALIEQTETFSLVLSNPTGGAVIGPVSTATVRIVTNDQPSPPRPGSGGAVGFWSLLLLGAMNLLRRARRRDVGT